MFLAFLERDWRMDKDLALDLLRSIIVDVSRASSYACIQVLQGIERHGVSATDIDLGPIVERLIGLGCAV